MEETNSFIFNSDPSDRRGLRRFLWKSTYILPLMIAIAAINASNDPAHLFKPSSYEDGIAKILAQGNNVVNPTNQNERLVQKTYVSHLLSANDVIVLGSSRSMQIGRDTLGRKLGGCSFFNNSVSGAILADQLAVFNRYYTAGLLPKTVIISVDPWLFNANHGEERYLSVYEDYQSAMAMMTGQLRARLTSRLRRAQSFFESGFQLISPSYLQASIEYAGAAQAGPQYVSSETFSDHDEPVIRSDGSYQYDKKTLSRNINEVKKEAIDYSETSSVYHLALFTQLDPELRYAFESFVRFLVKNQIKPVFFLAPYHPLAYSRMLQRPDTRIITEVEKYVRLTAAAHQIELIGSYDPAQVALNEENFIDGMHPKRAAVAKLFTSLASTCSASNERASDISRPFLRTRAEPDSR